MLNNYLYDFLSHHYYANIMFFTDNHLVAQLFISCDDCLIYMIVNSFLYSPNPKHPAMTKSSPLLSASDSRLSRVSQ